MTQVENDEAKWEKAIEKALELYKKDLDLLREYDRKAKTSHPARD